MFSSNPILKVRKHGFSLYLSIHNFANFYYFLNMRKPPKRATFQLSISQFTCIILIFLTGDIADWMKKIAGFAMTDIRREKMIGRQICFFILISDEQGIIWTIDLSFFPAICRSLRNLQFFFQSAISPVRKIKIIHVSNEMESWKVALLDGSLIFKK